jgi:hypothetical protein
MKSAASPRFYRILGVACMSLASLLAGCHSYRIEATVENHTGGPITLLEVDYPSASFGADSLAADSIFRYRFQTRGSGAVTVQYTTADGRQVKITGPTLHEKQEGAFEIVLAPGGKAAFHVALNPKS